jgi:hypothetical protein
MKIDILLNFSIRSNIGHISLKNDNVCGILLNYKTCFFTTERAY